MRRGEVQRAVHHFRRAMLRLATGRGADRAKRLNDWLVANGIDCSLDEHAFSAARFPGTLVVSPDGRNGLTASIDSTQYFQLRALDKLDLRCNALVYLDAAALDGVMALIDQLIR